MKYTYFLLLLTSLNVSAQKLHQHWTTELIKLSDCEYELVFKVTLDKGWHIYSIVPSEDKGEGAPNATTIKFDKNPRIQLLGKITESKPKSALDEVFKTTVRTHEKSVVFKQKIKVTGKGPLKIAGEHQADECNDGGCIFVPGDVFEFNLTANGVCK
jgi:hypothetical protein